MINFIFNGRLPLDAGMKCFDFEKKSPQGKGGPGGLKFGLDDKR